MAWKLSIADPSIYNNSFRVPTRLKSTLSGSLSVGASSIVITATTWGIYATVGDYLLIGPSTNSSYLGKTELIQVSSISSGTITSLTNTVNAYASGDSIECIGTRLAAGWNLYNDFSMVATGIYQFKNDTTKIGFDVDNAQQRLTKTAGSGASYLRYYFDKVLRPNTVYRQKVWYHLINNNNNLSFKLYEGATPTEICGSTIYEGEGTSEDTGTSGSTYQTSYYPYFEIAAATATTFDDLYLDLFHLGHATFTSGASSGYLSFPDNPISDIRTTFGKSTSMSSSAINSLESYFYTVGFARETLTVEVEFEGDSTFIRDLEILKYWMDRGCRIILEHDMSTGASTSIKNKISPLIMGTFEFSFSKRFWDTNRNTIQFTFEGEV